MKSQIVIVGMAGRFPESRNVHEFWENLFGGHDMVTEDSRRWAPGLYGLPSRQGKLNDLEKFDADHFSIHPKQANSMDPQLRILLEVTHEAIFDAGICPKNIRGSKTGVFVAASVGESEKIWFNNENHDTNNTEGYAILGTHRAMFSNRISFAFDLHGPSQTVDTACSSSLVALEQAVIALKNGLCEAAVVAGVSLCLDPRTSIQYNKLSMLSPDGKCKSFDATANGYARSEAVVAIFLQKQQKHMENSAGGIPHCPGYGTILGVTSNSDGWKEQGITFPSGDRQKSLLKEVYQEAGINPLDVDYVETHGTGTAAGDPQELQAITEVFCPGRKSPLLIGSVKSNMGHAEPASGLCSLVKVILTCQHGVIPANLHFNNPNPKIPALIDGRLQVVTKNTPWNGQLVAINSFGFGGTNAHMIFRSNFKNDPETLEEKNKWDIPLVVPFSGRTAEAVQKALVNITRQLKSEYLRYYNPVHLTSFAHDIFQANMDMSSHLHRGFLLISREKTGSDPGICNKIKMTSTFQSSVHVGDQPLDIKKQPEVWFIFSGMGGQWAGMGCSLLNLPICRQSLEKSAQVLFLQGLKVDLLELLQSEDKSLFENVLHSFVGISAVQVALVDLLTSLDIRPDGIIGHSVGELVAAYADGSLTSDQVILCAYARGQAILEMVKEEDSRMAMAAVGLSWREAHEKCPASIFPACHNSRDNVTVSGPAKDISDFVKDLQSRDIFAKEVDSSGQAFHSKYIEPARPQFQRSLEKIIPEPRARSSRWVSSSIAESRWDSTLARFSSAEYHANNLLSPVLFQEALEKVPESSIVIEIGPHCLLQAILKRSLPHCSHVALMSKFVDKSTHLSHLSTALGKLWNLGLNPGFQKLYPEFPGDKRLSLSSVVSFGWDHSKSWAVPDFTVPSSSSSLNQSSSSPRLADSGQFSLEISMDKEADAFYEGHQINGRVLLPKAAYIVEIWKLFAQLQQKPLEKCSVVIENMVVHQLTLMPKNEGKNSVPPIIFNIRISKRTGEFEFESSPDGQLVASGIIRRHEEVDLPGKFDGHLHPTDPVADRPDSPVVLDQRDVYKELRLFGYQYSGLFQGINRVCPDREESWAELEFTGNWVTCLDTFFQLVALSKTIQNNDRNLYLPTSLDKLVLNPEILIQSSSSSSSLTAVHRLHDKVLEGPGVRIEGLKWKLMQKNRLNQEELAGRTPVLEKFEFTRHIDNNQDHVNEDQDDEHCLRACTGIVLENAGGGSTSTLDVIEIVQEESKDDEQRNLINLVQDICFGEPLKSCKCSTIIVKQESTIPTKPDPARFNQGSQSNQYKYLDHVSKICPAVKEVSGNSAENCFLLVQEAEFLEQAAKSLKTDSFLLFKEKTGELEKVLEEPGLTLVARKISTSGCHFHLFKKTTESLNTKVINLQVDDLNFKWVDSLKRTLEKDESISRINLISMETTGASGILGLVKSLRMELGGRVKISGFLIDNPSKTESPHNFDFESPDENLQRILQQGLATNVFQGGSWGSFRFSPLFRDTQDKEREIERETTLAYMNIKRTGDLSTFQWISSPLKYYQPQSSLCSVFYSALNFRDVMLATGKLTPDSLPQSGQSGDQHCLLGMEFSGHDSERHRVMGIVPGQGIATKVKPDPSFLWKVPHDWSLGEGATVPVAYSTAYYALIVRGQLQRNETVLIHSGAGAVGMAAIRIALSMDCRIFTTVGSLNKRSRLMEIFPELGPDCFANSRNVSFVQHVLRETRGQGVDLVLNSLAGDKLKASLKCLGQNGRFLEIGKFDLSNDTKIGLAVLLKNVSVHGILLDSLFETASEDQKRVGQLVGLGIQTGVVRPLPSTQFAGESTEEVEAALRFMASGKHFGKIILKIKGDNQLEEKKVKAMTRTFFDPSKVYIIVGGLGGFGLELCHWLIQRQAKNILLVSRSGASIQYQRHCLKKWGQVSQASVIPWKMELTSYEDACLLLNQAMEAFDHREIGGIFNLAMVLADGLFENQTPENFQRVFCPKGEVTRALDLASRTLAPNLQYFVVFSSVVSGRGAQGLTNYAWANSAMERICEGRRRTGFPALSVQWGAIGDVGVLQEEHFQKLGSNSTSQHGTEPQPIDSCMDVLDKFLCLQELDENFPHTVSSLIPVREKTTEVNSSSLSEEDEKLREVIGRILGLRSASELVAMDPAKTLQDFGIDSLMVGEIRQLLQVKFGQMLGPSEFRRLTFGRLNDIIKSNLKPPRNLPDPDNEEAAAKDSSMMEQDEREPQKQPKSDKNPVPAPVIFNSGDLDKIYQSKNPGFIYPFVYLYSLLLIGLTALAFHLSNFVRFGLNLYFEHFVHESRSKNIKLVSRPMDQFFAASPTVNTHVTVLKMDMEESREIFPDKARVVKELERKLFSDQQKEGVGDSNLDLLRWTLHKGRLFYYWKRAEDFNMDGQVVLEKIPVGSTFTLDEEMNRLVRFYHNFQWEKPQEVKEKDGGMSRILRPFWRIHLAFPTESGAGPDHPGQKQFLLVLAMHHSYCDGPSVMRLIRKLTSGEKLIDINDLAEIDSTVQTSEVKVMTWFQRTHLLAIGVSNMLIDCWTAQAGHSLWSLTRTREAETQLVSASASLTLTQLKRSLKKVNERLNREKRESITFNAFFLTVVSRVYRRLYMEGHSQDQGQRLGQRQCPPHFVAFVTRDSSSFADDQAKHSSMLENNISCSYTPCCALRGQGQGQGQEESMTDFRIVEDRLKSRSEPVVSQLMKEFQDRYSLLIRPFLGLALRFSPGPDFVYSNVLTAAVSGGNHSQFLGYRLNGVFGYIGPMPIGLVLMMDSVNDRVNLGLTVNMNPAFKVPPQFHQKFFPYLEQEINRLCI